MPDVLDGPELELTDNEKYCAFARFCDAYGKVWNLVEESDDQEARELTVPGSELLPCREIEGMGQGEGRVYREQVDSLARSAGRSAGTLQRTFVRSGSYPDR